jgi:hypothetical protein
LGCAPNSLIPATHTPRSIPTFFLFFLSLTRVVVGWSQVAAAAAVQHHLHTDWKESIKKTNQDNERNPQMKEKQQNLKLNMITK